MMSPRSKPLSLTLIAALTLGLASAGSVHARGRLRQLAERLDDAINKNPDVAGHARSEAFEGGAEFLTAAGQAITGNEGLTASSATGGRTSFLLFNPTTGDLMRVSGNHLRGGISIAPAAGAGGDEETVEAEGSEGSLEDLFAQPAEEGDDTSETRDEESRENAEEPRSGYAVIARGRITAASGGAFGTSGGWLAQYRLGVETMPSSQEEAEAVFDEAFGPEARRGEALKHVYYGPRSSRPQAYYAKTVLDLPLPQEVVGSLHIGSAGKVKAILGVVQTAKDVMAVITIIGTASGLAVSN